jgi:putative FmdB family regulatory protein
MPIYEYECNSCKHRFDIKQGFHDKPQAECPRCQKKARRVFHAAPIIFKGSGFYVTDHSSSNPAAQPSAKKDGDSKPEAKSESKSESKSEAKTESKPEAKKAESKKTTEKSR